MDAETLRLLALYNQKTNQEMNALLGQLTPEQWDKRFDGYYPNIHLLCNHLYIGDSNWLNHFGGMRDFGYFKDKSIQPATTFDKICVGDQIDYLGKRERIDQKFIEFAAEVRDADFKGTLTFTTSKGIELTKSFGGIVLHVFNHQTHHRGMISIYLDSLGVNNDFSNLLWLA